MRKSAKENIIVVCTIVLCFMLTVGLCTLYSGEGILGVFSFNKSGGSTEYAIVVGGYTDITLARGAAELIKNRGGAGYVTNGESIEIVYAVYPDEDSAEKVLAGLDDPGAYIKEITINASKLKWANDGSKEDVEAALAYYENAYKTLYETANRLSDGSMSAEDAKTQIRVLYARIDDLKSAFYQNTADKDSEKITEVKLALITAIALIDNIKTNGTVAIFVSSMRYALVQLVMCRQALMSRI